MKKILPCLLLFLTSYVNSQPYTPLLDSNNMWCFTGNYLVTNIPDTVFSGPCSPSFPTFYADKVYTSVDTTINGQQYRCVESAIYNFSYICRYGFIREDTAARKIYFIDNQFSPEILIYDFSLQVGDSFPMTFYNSPGVNETGLYILDSILPFSTASGITRAFYLNCMNCNFSQNTIEWLEGIGTRTELALPMSFNLQASGGQVYFCGNDFPYNEAKILTSFQHINRVYYDSCTLQIAMNTNCFVFDDTCSYWSNCAAINENNPGPSIKVTPNPADDFIYITTDDDKQEIIHVYLKDIKGNTVLNEGEISLSKNKKNKINVSMLKPGMYFIEATGHSGTSYRKILIN
ncbi:MAG: T9SS type A sorting domain-containing protein [Bacteroidota bacterium]